MNVTILRKDVINMATATVTTRQTRLNVRSGPSISHSIVGKLAKGQTIEITSDTFSEGGWTWVGYGGNWVCQKDPRYSYPFLNIQAEEATPAPAEPAPAPVTPNYDDLIAGLVNSLDTGTEIKAGKVKSINGSAVQYEDERWQADKHDVNEEWKANRYRGQMTKSEIASLDRWSPEWVQNSTGYPPVKQFNSKKQMYEYNYEMDYARDNLVSDMQGLRKTLNISVEGRDELFRLYTTNYNRFKMANPNDQLSKTYSHVFFVRPDCNVLTRAGTGWVLPEKIVTNPNYKYAYYHSPELLKQLVYDAGYDSDFMMFLSNKARSFSLSDEGIESDTYGKALTGHKVVYGKTNVASKTAGSFSINYIDDRDLHVFHIHKLWADYISNVYQGVFNPKLRYMRDRILDYVSDVYYFLCAEDGETIIFWSKYYGVFPVSIPSSQYSWAAGSTITAPDFEVQYQYSFKEDFNPLSIIEFNMNSGSKKYSYVPVIDKNNYMTNTTWVGAPFIETFNDSVRLPYTFKLRFRKG